jgi:hypothetical protein
MNATLFRDYYSDRHREKYYAIPQSKIFHIPVKIPSILQIPKAIFSHDFETFFCPKCNAKETTIVIGQPRSIRP